VAAGAFLLLYGRHPELPLADAVTLFDLTRSTVEPGSRVDDPSLADRRDLEPFGIDSDGHNAKHGYGRLNAAGACLAASDPIAYVLVAMGEPAAALRYWSLRQQRLAPLYSPGLARWATRATMRDPTLIHALSAVLRALRLAAARREAPEL